MQSPPALSCPSRGSEFNVNSSDGAEIQETVYFNIVGDNELDLDTSLNHVRTLQDLLTLATGKVVRPLEVVGKNRSDGKGRYKDTEILFEAFEDSSIPDSLHSMKANFTYSDIADRFGEIVNNWFSKKEKLKPLYDLYFGFLYRNDMFLQNQFLSLTQSLEFYHRSEWDGKYLGEDQFERFYEDLVEEIPEEFPSDFKMHLEQGTFRYTNEYSLRKRLKFIVEENQRLLVDLPWEYEKKIDEIVNARNRLTHYDS